MKMLNDDVRPGFHRAFNSVDYTESEQLILRKLSQEWYITKSGTPINLGASSYRYFFMKPTAIFSEMFNIDREIVCIFSPYTHFEPRTLDAFDEAVAKSPQLRLESVCRVLISATESIEQKIEDLIKSDPEQPVVIPFSYKELLDTKDPYFIRNRFRRHFYSRDLFAFSSPLKKDLYFFGRNPLVHDLVNRHRSGEHAGLFGLRKSGKTSIIYAIERLMSANDEVYVSIDCESPSIHRLRWYELLHKIVAKYHATRDSKISLRPMQEYTEKMAAELFESEILAIYGSKKRKRSLFVFDEIEHISPDTGSSEHWKSNEDFVLFWQSMRAFHQRHSEVMTYMLVGTNPSAVERAKLCGGDNPLFGSIPVQYVPSFTYEQVREMVRKLGRYMGIKFDEMVFAKIAEEWGGHPFLIRQFCSKINSACTGDRPINVDRAMYESVKRSFAESADDYLESIVQVLHDWYRDEYDMLMFLAMNDHETFKKFATDHNLYTRHLLGYGLIQQSEHGFTFIISSLREHLAKKHKFKKLNMTTQEMVDECSARRNQLEKSLRLLTKRLMKLEYGDKAVEVLLGAIPGERREKMRGMTIEQLTNSDSCPLYFSDLTALLKREWKIFGKIFSFDCERMSVMMADINRYARPDAHAKNIKKEDFDLVRNYFERIEKAISDW